MALWWLGFWQATSRASRQVHLKNHGRVVVLKEVTIELDNTTISLRQYHILPCTSSATSNSIFPISCTPTTCLPPKKAPNTLTSEPQKARRVLTATQADLPSDALAPQQSYAKKEPVKPKSCLQGRLHCNGHGFRTQQQRHGGQRRRRGRRTQPGPRA